MGFARRRSESGQTQVEYVLLFALLVFGCLVAVLVLGRGIEGRFGSDGPFGSTTVPSTPGPFTPPTQTSFPTSVEQCQNGGWSDFPQFTGEAGCIRFVLGLTP